LEKVLIKFYAKEVITSNKKIITLVVHTRLFLAFAVMQAQLLLDLRGGGEKEEEEEEEGSG
jgi:hypothetical protein